MFSIHDFIMSCLQGMIGQYPDFQVREFALNWYAKGKINEGDLAQIEIWLTTEPEPPVQPIESINDDSEFEEPTVEDPFNDPEPIEDPIIDDPESSDSEENEVNE